jgi:hypothetical protein
MLRAWLLLFIAALVLRLGMVFYWEHHFGAEKLYFGDSETYWVLGQALAEQKPYLYKDEAVFRMPGYPAVLALLFHFYRGEQPILMARIENAVIGTLAVLAVACLALVLFQKHSVALIAGFLAAFDPLNIVMSALVLSEASFCLAMMLQLICWTKAIRGLTEKPVGCGFSLLFAGLFSAAAVYCRPDWLLFVPFAVFAGILFAPHRFKIIFATGLYISIITVLCLTPWWLRNYTVSGHFIPTTLQTGASLYDGLSPNADGSSNMEFVQEFRDKVQKENPQFTKIQWEYEYDQTMKQAAIDWAANPENRNRVIELVKIKLLRLWNIVPNEASFSALPVKIAVAAAFCPAAFFGVLGLLRSFGSGFSVRLLAIPAVYITLLHVIFVSSIRYRAPAMLCVAVLAAWVIADMFFRKK